MSIHQELITFLRNRQTFLGASRRQCDEHGKEFWDQYDQCIDLISAMEPKISTQILPNFEDPMVQVVYECIADDGEVLQPPLGEHWESYVSRVIVGSLRQLSLKQPTVAYKVNYPTNVDAIGFIRFFGEDDSARMQNMLKSWKFLYAEDRPTVIELVERNLNFNLPQIPVRVNIPEGWYLAVTGSDELVVRSPQGGPGGITLLPDVSSSVLAVRILDALCRDMLKTSKSDVTEALAARNQPNRIER